MNKYYIFFVFVILPQLSFSQAAVYDPAQFANMVKSLENQARQEFKQEKMIIEQTKTTIATKAMSGDINQILSMQQDALKAMNKYSQLITFNPADLVCMLDRMGQLFKNQMPKTTIVNFGNLLKYNCQNQADRLYNKINPYNMYAKYGGNKSGSVYNSNNHKDYYKALKESKEANMNIVDLNNKNKVEMSALYDKMGEEKIARAKKMAIEINTVSSPDVRLKMQEDLEKLMKEGMELKQKSLDMLVEAGKTDKYQQMEMERQNSKMIKKELANIPKMKYGVY